LHGWLGRAQRRSSEAEAVPAGRFCDHFHILWDLELACGHFREKAFKAARRQNDQMPRRHVADTFVGSVGGDVSRWSTVAMVVAK
jgi:hypothetical protein